MITTRFGTEVKLLTPVEWSTGWVRVLANLGDNGEVEKEVHLSDLQADDGINEIQAASDALVTMTKTTKRPVGRPPIHPPQRKRRNLNIERNPDFDSCLVKVRQIMAAQDGVDFWNITQSDAIRYAVYMVANKLEVK